MSPTESEMAERLQCLQFKTIRCCGCEKPATSTRGSVLARIGDSRVTPIRAGWCDDCSWKFSANERGDFGFWKPEHGVTLADNFGFSGKAMDAQVKATRLTEQTLAEVRDTLALHGITLESGWSQALHELGVRLAENKRLREALDTMKPMLAYIAGDPDGEVAETADKLLRIAREALNPPAGEK